MGKPNDWIIVTAVVVVGLCYAAGWHWPLEHLEGWLNAEPRG